MCVLVLEFKKTSVCRFRLCRFLSPLFYLFSFFKSVYLTCFGPLFFLFFSFFLSLCLAAAAAANINKCVCRFFTPKKKRLYQIYKCIVYLLSFIHFLSDDKLGTASLVQQQQTNIRFVWPD